MDTTNAITLIDGNTAKIGDNIYFNYSGHSGSGKLEKIDCCLYLRGKKGNLFIIPFDHCYRKEAVSARITTEKTIIGIKGNGKYKGIHTLTMRKTSVNGVLVCVSVWNNHGFGACNFTTEDAVKRINCEYPSRYFTAFHDGKPIEHEEIAAKVA